ncbi:hypothetical protein XENOCAPTIV_013621 [Xenoophorus captivus]|uniref:Uncharacterized protein n=1 Tax=Xenoophorus captivus TaxID=1517983 RepID=A0ABV0QLT9_9TELE
MMLIISSLCALFQKEQKKNNLNKNKKIMYRTEDVFEVFSNVVISTNFLQSATSHYAALRNKENAEATLKDFSYRFFGKVFQAGPECLFIDVYLLLLSVFSYSNTFIGNLFNISINDRYHSY